MKHPSQLPAPVWPILSSIALLAAGYLGASPNDPPNFIVILADDLGYGDLGCQGSTVNRTPNLDRLAREGMRFLDFHSNAANCSPTRAALLTGRYQQHAGIEGALGEGAKGLPQSSLTIAERLQEAGYSTALLGKWHLGYEPENGPTRHGFDTFVGHLHGATDYHSHVDKYGRMDWWHNEEPVEEAGYNTTLITEHSLRFLDEHADDPFFLMIAHSAIHFPWQTSDDASYRERGKRYEGAIGKLGPHAEGPVQPVVRQMIEELDTSVGEIITALERLELNNRTLVFFTSDNGGIVRMAGVPATPENRISSNAPLRGQKHGLYEGGHRVPAIAWWPGTITPDSDASVTGVTMDLYPTLLELAGLNATEPLDGVSLAGALRGNESIPERTLFWRQGDSYAARDGDWKIVSIHNSPFELYDLGADLGEQKNVAAQYPEVLRQLQTQLKDWEAQYLEPR